MKEQPKLLEKTPKINPKTSINYKVSPNPNPFYLPSSEQTLANCILNKITKQKRSKKSETDNKSQKFSNQKYLENIISENSIEKLNKRIAKFF